MGGRLQPAAAIGAAVAARRLLCSPPGAVQTAKLGDFVTVDYTGTLDDGTVFDTSRKEGRTALEFEIGGGMVSSFGLQQSSLGSTCCGATL